MVTKQNQALCQIQKGRKPLVENIETSSQSIIPGESVVLYLFFWDIQLFHLLRE